MAPRSRATGRTPAPRRPAAATPGPAGPSARLREVLREIIEPVVSGTGYDLEQVTVSRAGRRYLIRVIVDGDDGVSLDAVAEVSRAVSAALDEAEATAGELMAGEYQLEVSSPGVDRPLTQPRHWRRNRGRLVRVAVAGQQVTARVAEADEAGIVLAMGPDRRVPYAELGPGRVQVEFSRPDEGDGDRSGDGDGFGDGDDSDESDDFNGDGDDMFDDGGFARDDGVMTLGGKQSRSPGVDSHRPGRTGDQGPTEGHEREDEER